MNSLTLPFPWLPLIIFFSLTTLLTGAKTTPFRIPRLGVRVASTEQDQPMPAASNDVVDTSGRKTLYFRQTLDHFNYRPESYVTFRQRYVINSKYWGGGNVSAPILAYLGEEAPIDWDVTGIGFLNENAPRFKALTVYIEEVSESCVDTITKSWSEIDIIAAQPNGLSLLSQKFNTCSTLKDSSDLKNYLEAMYMIAARYDAPPKYPVTAICRAIDGAPAGSDNLTRIFAGMVSYIGYQPCYITTTLTSETTDGWNWQVCSEIVMPIGRENDTMFPPKPFVLEAFIEHCTAKYGVPPRPHWVTSYYGGHDIKLVLSKFGSNIIFSNGLKDPYSSGGVLENISDSIVALHTKNGSHCLDLFVSNPSTDQQWLVDQRLTEVAIIEGWFVEYYKELHALK